MDFCQQTANKSIVLHMVGRGVVVPERRSGKYFWAGTALRQILFITAWTLILQRSGKSAHTIKKLPYTQNLANWFSGKS